jgi:carboxylesterase type B
LPRSPDAWDGVRNATNFGNAAIQTVETGVELVSVNYRLGTLTIEK